MKSPDMCHYKNCHKLVLLSEEGFCTYHAPIYDELTAPKIRYMDYFDHFVSRLPWTRN